jgi:hypothetical protein
MEQTSNEVMSWVMAGGLMDWIVWIFIGVLVIFALRKGLGLFSYILIGLAIIAAAVMLFNTYGIPTWMMESYDRGIMMFHTVMGKQGQ